MYRNGNQPWSMSCSYFTGTQNWNGKSYDIIDPPSTSVSYACTSFSTVISDTTCLSFASTTTLLVSFIINFIFIGSIFSGDLFLPSYWVFQNSNTIFVDLCTRIAIIYIYIILCRYWSGNNRTNSPQIHLKNLDVDMNIGFPHK